MKKRHPNKAIITHLAGDLKVRIYPHDVIGMSIYVNEMFEPAECRFVMKFLQHGMIFFDIGANLGQYTLLASRQVGPKGQVHSFEPNGRMFAELRYNVELNGFSGICTLNNMAVSDKEGTAKLSLYKPGDEVYGSLGHHKREEGALLGYEEVKTIRLDGYIKETGVSRIDLIKMDIEGAELPALKGAAGLLSRDNAPAIVFEMADINTIGFGYHAIEIWDYLNLFGYQIYHFDKHGLISGLAQRPADFSEPQNLLALKDGGAFER